MLREWRPGGLRIIPRLMRTQRGRPTDNGFISRPIALVVSISGECRPQAGTRFRSLDRPLPARGSHRKRKVCTSKGYMKVKTGSGAVYPKVERRNGWCGTRDRSLLGNAESISAGPTKHLVGL